MEIALIGPGASHSQARSPRLHVLAFHSMTSVEETLSEILWFVAHTRPRCEKKLVQYCRRERIETVLPLLKSVKKYRGKTVTFQKPVFPNYVFLRMERRQRQAVFQNGHVANLLDVPDQVEFERQLQDILDALETDLEIILAPQIRKGSKVKIVHGPLRGMEGWVASRTGTIQVQLRLDFIGQGVAVALQADEVELI